MQIIRGQLSAMYIQHEAIEAQKLMVNSPNHTTVYIPVGPMGVPLTGTFGTGGKKKKKKNFGVLLTGTSWRAGRAT